VIAWRKATPANLRRVLAVPAAVTAVTLVVLLAAGDAADKPTALAMFCLAAFVLAVVAQEFWRGIVARRAMSSDSVPQAFVSLLRRNRRRYGGYIVHAGIAVLFVGVAASSAFQDARDVRLAPGQSARVGDHEITYVRSTGNIDVSSNGSLEKINLGADLRVKRGGGGTEIVHTERSYFPSNDPSMGAVSRYFGGEATSEVGLRPGFRRDFWTTVAPDIGSLTAISKRGDAVFERARSLPREERSLALGEALRRLVERYREEPSQATFRVLVTPLVTWIWLGALIVFAGGVITLWPPPAGARQKAAAPYAARLGRELGRA
jgi:cytochrome c-type biogenesis protein CcmF